jgi:DNA repair exonuclease SbcCD ATPase subunit
MGRDGRGFGGRLFEAGTKLVSRAAERVLNDPRGQDAVARAVGLAQRGRRRVEEVQRRLMEAAGIPGRQEYDELQKQLARLKRKARELSQKLEAAGEPEGEDESPPGNGDAHH